MDTARKRGWLYLPMPLHLNENEVTQRDQFQNDEVSLTDTLVRESTQNTLDAKNGSMAGISFHIVGVGDGLTPQFIDQVLDGHIHHAKAVDLDLTDVNFSQPKALVIEDFETTGLTGAVNREDDEGNFADFWRRHGKSHKSGTRLGRWGLGKLVYSSASQVKAFFGITVQSDTNKRYLMGQSVLETHRLAGKKYPPHNLYGEETEVEGGPFQVPIDDECVLNDFAAAFRLARRQEPGLSIIIPFPRPQLQMKDMIGFGVENYFIPILRGQLMMRFDGVTLNSETILKTAHEYAGDRIKNIDQLFGFIKEADRICRNGGMVVAANDWYKDGHLGVSAFSGIDLETMRKAFVSSGMIAVKLPVDIQKKPPAKAQQSYVDIFLIRPDKLDRGSDFYVRNGITLPSEAKFRERRCLGLLLAEDEPVSAFLGDAENPAHTKWSSSAEKLDKYRGAQVRLKALRNCLVDLHDLLAQNLEEEDEQALVDFFWADEKGEKKKHEGDNPPPPPKPPAPRPSVIRIAERQGGFSVLPSTGIKAAEFPIDATLTVAYDVPRGNPFRLYSEFDFNLAVEGDVEIEAKGNVVVHSAEKNVIACTISGPDFELNIGGLDTKRDVIVKAEA